MVNIVAPLDSTIDNFSQLSPNKFKVVIGLFPDTAFWAQKVTLPAINLGQNVLGTNTFLKWTTPGDTLSFDDLVISFIMDEDIVAYRKLKQWQLDMVGRELPNYRFSDLQIMLLTNNSNKNHSFKFSNTWPSTVGSFTMDTTVGEDQPITVEVSFKHTSFDIDPPIIIIP